MVGGARGFHPVDLLGTGPASGAARIAVRSREGGVARVEVVDEQGNRSDLEVVEVEGRWAARAPGSAGAPVRWCRLMFCLAACSSGSAGGEDPPRRVSVAGVHFDARGVSAPVRVSVPERTRSLAVVVRGDDRALYALASLETADGRRPESGSPTTSSCRSRCARRTSRRRSASCPGDLHQSIRLGTFTAIYPDRPGRALPAGEAVIRVATSEPGAARSMSRC
jgi:hypothetical protein